MPYSDPEAKRHYQREWMARRRAEYLVDKSCVDCGGFDDLEIDHVDPSLKITHRIWSWSVERRETELLKCEVRCSECHRRRTREQHIKPLIHGTYNGYHKKRCRCMKCRRYHADEMRAWRAARRSGSTT